METKKTGLNSNQIKLIAIIAMTIDHLVWTIFPGTQHIVLWSAIYASVYFLFLDKPYGILQMFTFLTIPILAKYNGKRGEWKGMKWLFYFYYPVHLFVIGIVRILLHGNISTIF